MDVLTWVVVEQHQADVSVHCKTMTHCSDQYVYDVKFRVA